MTLRACDIFNQEKRTFVHSRVRALFCVFDFSLFSLFFSAFFPFFTHAFRLKKNRMGAGEGEGKKREILGGPGEGRPGRAVEKVKKTKKKRRKNEKEEKKRRT